MAELFPAPIQRPMFDASGKMTREWQEWHQRATTDITVNAAPSDARYLILTANALLTQAQNLGLLTSGWMFVTVAAGVAAVSSHATISAGDISGTLDVQHGGTGVATLTAHGVLLGEGITPIVATAVGATNTVLHGNSGADPSFSAVVEADLSLSDTTTDNVSSTKHGFAPKSPGNADFFLNGAATPAFTNILPLIRADGRVTAQTAAVASIATYTVGAADASFYVSANVNVTTSTTHNFTLSVDYTDETNTAQTMTLAFSVLAGTFINNITNGTGAGPYAGVPVHIRCKAATAITVKSVGTFTTVTYNAEARVTEYP